MLDKQLFKFYLSYKLEGEIYLEWVEGINLRHAKDKVQFRHPEASDLMDWTNEKKEDLDKYLAKVKESHSQTTIHVDQKNSPKED